LLVELSVVEQRYDAVMAVLREGLKVTEAAELAGTHRSSVHRWLRRYAEGGMAALSDRSHRPASCPHQMGEKAELMVLEMRRKHPDWGPRRLVFELKKKEEVQVVPSRSAVYRALVRNGLIEPQRRRKGRKEYRRWERGYPMALWQMDLMTTKLTTGKRVWVITGIDDFSRFCVAARVVERATSKAVCRTMSDSMRRYGVPEEILTDNGKVFTGRFTDPQTEVLFDRICRENGIDHILTKVASPTTTGKIERFHRTLKEELFSKRNLESITEAQQAVDLYVEEYNRTRPHQAIGMDTPSERFVAGTEVPVSPHKRSRRAKPSEFPELADVVRKVGQGGSISLGGVPYRLGRPFAGKLVTVRIVRGVVQVFLNDRLIKAFTQAHSKEVTIFQTRKAYLEKVG
jgi:transposase InsO family protein